MAGDRPEHVPDRLSGTWRERARQAGQKDTQWGGTANVCHRMNGSSSRCSSALSSRSRSSSTRSRESA